MPFTASHVAAVLPFVRTPLIPSALVVGSMVPDLPLFSPLPIYSHTHSVLGVFVINAAAGFAGLLVWHALLAEPAYATYPQALRRRLPPPDPRSVLRTTGWPRRLLLTYLSLVIGAATHVTWDAFTHPGRWGSQRIDWLAEYHGPVLGTTWAQYGSTVLGAAVIAVWLVRWWRRTPPRDPADAAQGESAPAVGRLAWLIAPLLGGTVALTVTSPLVLDHGSSLHRAVFVAVTYGIATTMTVALLLAIGWHLRRRGYPHHEPGLRHP